MNSEEILKLMNERLEREEKLKQIYEKFADDLKNIADRALGDIVAEILPYAQLDLEFNVFSYSRQLVRDFLSDNLTHDHHDSMSDIFKEFNSKEVRKKMLEEYHDELMNDIIKDKDREIEHLKSEIDYLRRQWSL